MNIFLRKKFFRLLQICLLTLCGLSGGCADWDSSVSPAANAANAAANGARAAYRVAHAGAAPDFTTEDFDNMIVAASVAYNAAYKAAYDAEEAAYDAEEAAYNAAHNAAYNVAQAALATNAANAAKAAAADEAVMALLFPQTPPKGTDLDTPNITTMDLAGALKNNIMAAVITGNLAYDGGGIGIYGFNVNLSDGGISSGAMRSNDNGYMFSVHSGTGQVTGNDFSVSNFQGSVVGTTYAPGSQTKLDGTASAGFGNVGNLGATGTFTVTGGTGNSPVVNNGTITDGKRDR